MNPTLAAAIAKLAFDHADPQTDSQIDDLLELINDTFAPEFADPIIAALWEIIDADPH